MSRQRGMLPRCSRVRGWGTDKRAGAAQTRGRGCQRGGEVCTSTRTVIMLVNCKAAVPLLLNVTGPQHCRHRLTVGCLPLVVPGTCCVCCLSFVEAQTRCHQRKLSLSPHDCSPAFWVAAMASLLARMHKGRQGKHRAAGLAASDTAASWICRGVIHAL